MGPGDYLKTFDPALRCHTGDFDYGSHLIKLSFDDVFFFFMRYAVYLIAICLVFSNFQIANPFVHVEQLTWYSPERVVLL